MGFMQQTSLQVTEQCDIDVTQFEGVKANPSLLVIFTQCLDQIAA